MNRKKTFALALLLTLVLAVALPAMSFAASETPAVVSTLSDDAAIAVNEKEAEAKTVSTKAMACAFTIAVGAGVGAIAMALASRKASESIARQPEAAGEVRSAMMLSLVFIETAIIYALLVVIMIIFVL